MAQAILGMKAAWEKAQQGNGGKRPSAEQVAAALKGSTFEGPGGTERMAIGKGNQAIMETAYGMSERKGGKITITNVRRYPAERVNPPEGVKSADWIKNGFKK
jgi:branched-chain amino acid transport system substrate-binding protein